MAVAREAIADWDSVWPAPAKLNLFLNIVGRRADGYHEIQTVFQLVDLVDELRFEPRDDDRVVCRSGHADITDGEDLVTQAAEMLRAACGLSVGISVTVTKTIPVGGGLGGGSSDAATALVALNTLWNLGLGERALADIGVGLGADVPVFVLGHSAWAEGIGDKIEPLDLPASVYLILFPGGPVSTAEVFSDPELTRQGAPLTIRRFLERGGDNVCTGIVRRRHPEVARALDWLGQHGDARLTGTGSCVYIAADNVARLEAILGQIPHGWTGYIARGINHSPLIEMSARRRHSGA